MDANRFDDLLRTLSLAPSRRRILRMVVGSALVGPPALIGASAADAKKQKHKKKRHRKKGKGSAGIPCHRRSHNRSRDPQRPAATASRTGSAK